MPYVSEALFFLCYSYSFFYFLFLFFLPSIQMVRIDVLHLKISFTLWVSSLLFLLEHRLYSKGNGGAAEQRECEEEGKWGASFSSSFLPLHLSLEVLTSVYSKLSHLHLHPQFVLISLLHTIFMAGLMFRFLLSTDPPLLSHPHAAELWCHSR